MIDEVFVTPMAFWALTKANRCVLGDITRPLAECNTVTYHNGFLRTFLVTERAEVKYFTSFNVTDRTIYVLEYIFKFMIWAESR